MLQNVLSSSRNRLPFHGAIDDRDVYEIEFMNVSNSAVFVTAALLVGQP